MLSYAAALPSKVMLRRSNATRRLATHWQRKEVTCKAALSIGNAKNRRVLKRNGIEQLGRGTELECVEVGCNGIEMNGEGNPW